MDIPNKIRVVLMDSEALSQHASGYSDVDEIISANVVKRNERTYVYYSYINNVVTYYEATTPYCITEW